MVLSSMRYLVLAATAFATLTSVNAANLTQFSVQYDVFTVTSEVQVEALSKAVTKLNNVQANDAFHKYVTQYKADVDAGTLTIQSHNDRIDVYLQYVDSIVPNFSDTANVPKFSKIANDEIDAAVVDFFKFQLSSYAASWDVLYYGASDAQSKVGNRETDAQLQTLDAYMTQNIPTAVTNTDFQAKSDEFFAAADKSAPGFKGIVYNNISSVYNSLWPSHSGSRTGKTAGSAGDDDSSNPSSGSNSTANSNSTNSRDNDVGNDPSHSPNSTTNYGGGLPAPGRASHAFALAPIGSITTVAAALTWALLM